LRQQGLQAILKKAIKVFSILGGYEMLVLMPKVISTCPSTWFVVQPQIQSALHLAR
jgi:hypothetical protein